jgi:predicted esterase
MSRAVNARGGSLRWSAVVVAALLAFGCGLELRPEVPPPKVAAAPPPGVGAVCKADTGCRRGLTCSSGSCQAAGNRAVGGECTLSAECQAGNYCTADAVCGPSGTSPEGGACKYEGECISGMVCALSGFGGTCMKAGPGDFEAACTKPSDCMAGLVCSLGKCETLETIEPWAGAVCPDTDPDKNASPVALFRVPHASDKSEDFYALPFPNDIRLKNGKVSLSGHPRPGARYLPFDPVAQYIQVIEEETLGGFGVNQAVYFRFSRAPTMPSVGAEGAVKLVNITPGSPEYGMTRPAQSNVTTKNGFYVCSPSLTLRPKWGSPLRPGETYAALLATTIHDAGGKTFVSDTDFKTMLGSAAPIGAELTAAWSAYAPLRAYLADKNVRGGDLAAAAVFTTQKVEEPLAALRAAVHAAAPAEIKSFVHCGDTGARSPCDDGKSGADHTRGCPEAAASDKLDEYQGTIAIPVFQSGKKPYETQADGGGIVFEGGTPQVQGSEDVCFVLTVPKGAAPGAGWPLVVYAHGTGGQYRSVVASGLADEYAAADVPGGPAVAMATFGYDGVLHANRRGGSERSPDELMYNFVNVRAARDNALQSAADLFVIARALPGLAANGVTIDARKVTLYGHSQGGNAGALAYGYEPTFGAAVLSGTGGTLTFSLLGKKKPVDIAAGVPLLLGDPKVDEDHPVLGLMQMYFERADPVNLGHRFFLDPPTGVPARHVLHVFGTGDSYAPVQTQRAFAQAAGFPELMPVIDDHLPVKVAAPVKGDVGGGAVTAVQAQYQPGNYDGHFVSTEHADARRLIRQMLGSFVRDGVPTVGP